jgi:uncharacterized damage-inducible protein DinB
MSTEVGITLEELLAWADESAHQWKSHIEAHPAILELPCSGINKSPNVQALVRHIWGAERRWSQRLAGLPTPDFPEGPLEALFAMHNEAVELYRKLLAEPAERWNETYELNFDWVPPERRHISRRKVAGHSLLHSQRHYAQLATLVREAGYPVTMGGDLLFSVALS